MHGGVQGAVVSVTAVAAVMMIVGSQGVFLFMFKHDQDISCKILSARDPLINHKIALFGGAAVCGP
jgi:hypothetical protein